MIVVVYQWLICLFFLNYAAAEPTLRDNANLREKSLVPLVIKVNDLDFR